MTDESDVDRLRALLGSDGNDAGREARIRAMNDDELLDAYRVLANPKLFIPGSALRAVETELRARGLSTARN